MAFMYTSGGKQYRIDSPDAIRGGPFGNDEKEKLRARLQADPEYKKQQADDVYKTQLKNAPEGYRNNPQFQVALREVVDSEWQGNKSVAVPLREKLNGIVTQLDPFPNGKENTNDPALKQAYGNAYAQKLINVEGGLLRKESAALSEASKKLGLSPDYSQGLTNTILGEPNTSGGGMGFFSSIGNVFQGIVDPVVNLVEKPTLKNLVKAAPTIGAAALGAGALGAFGGGAAAGAGAAGAGAGAGGTLLGSSTLGSLAGSLGLGGAVEAAPSVLASLGLSGAGTAAGASPYIYGSAAGVPASLAGTAVGGAAPTLLGSSTLAGLANSLGLGGLVEAAPNVLGSLGLSGGGSTALGSGVLSNLLGGGGQAGGSSGLFGTGLSLQDLLVGGGTAAGAYAAQDAARRAAEQQAQAAQQGIDIVRGAADRGINTLQTSSDKAATFQQPFYSAGQNALTRLQKILGLGGQTPDFTEITNNPAYQFRLQQGNNAVQNSAANAGNLFSGQTGKALTNYSQGLASTEYQNIINNLSNEATRGQNAGNQLSNIFQNTGVNQSNVGIQTGGAIADLLRTKGDAVASGTVGRTNAITGGVENLTNYLTRPVQYA